MKKILFAFCFAINLYGWSQVTITEPTEPGTFVYVDKADGGGLALEKITTRTFMSTDIKGENITLRMANPTSTVQIKKQEIMNFVYCYDKTSEGNQLFGFKLVVLTGEKKARKIITNVAPLNEANSVYPQVISGLVTSPYGDNSLLITANGLPAGEYAFVSGDHKLVTSYTEGENNVLKNFFAFTVVD